MCKQSILAPFGIQPYSGPSGGSSAGLRAAGRLPGRKGESGLLLLPLDPGGLPGDLPGGPIDDPPVGPTPKSPSWDFQDLYLTWTQDQIFDFSFLGALESISRVNFRWFMQRFSSRGRWARSWAQLEPKTYKNQETIKYIF